MDVPVYGEVLAANVRAERARAGISQRDLAEKVHGLGFDAWRYQTASDVERGKRRLTAEEAVAIAHVLGIPVVRLLSPPSHNAAITFPSGASALFPW